LTAKAEEGRKVLERPTKRWPSGWGAKLESDAMLIRSGIIDQVASEIAEESKRSIESHLVDFRTKMEAAGRTEQHNCQDYQAHTQNREVCAI